MDTGSSGIPFLDELRRKWHEDAISGGDALNQLTLWEDDAGNRTEQELEAAWALRGEIESDAAATQLIPTVRTDAPTPAIATPTSAPQVSAPESDEQIFDRISRLRDLATQATAARSRRDWAQIGALRAEAETLIGQYSLNGASAAMPNSLEAIFTGATEAQEAERLVGEAHASRRKGDFSEAAYRLAEAARLDPRYTPLSEAQQLVSDLQRALRDLRDNSLTSPEELSEGRKKALRLAEDDAAPESEYVRKKLAGIESEISRRVDASKQYVDADLATVEEPGSLDDRLQAGGRLGVELGKIETLRPDAPYLPDNRSRYIGARRQLERLKRERDTLLPEIASLDPQKGFDVGKLGSIVQKLTALSSAPLAKGDGSIDTAAQNLTHRLNAYLSSRLPTEQTGAPALQEYEQVLTLAQRGPHPLSPPQANTYNAAIQEARSGGRPPVIADAVRPGSVPPGSIPPGSTSPGPAPRSGSTPPPPRGTVPVSGGSTYPPTQSTPGQGSQYGTRPGTTPGSNPPGYGYGQPPGPVTAIPPHYTPPPTQVAPVAVLQPTARTGVPVVAWLLPLLIVLAVGGFFGWNAYQNDQNQKKIQAQIQAQATATAQAERTATAIVAAQRTEDAKETSTAQAIANAEATLTAEGEATANAQTTETAVAAVAETETVTAPNVGEAKANVEKVTVDYDVTQAGLLGMLIHVKFTADNLKGVPCGAAAYFTYSTGEIVKDTDGKFKTPDGEVAVSEPFNPGFDNAVYEDFKIFMPYNQIDVVGTGKFKLRFQVQAYILNPYKMVASSAFVDFELTK